MKHVCAVKRAFPRPAQKGKHILKKLPLVLIFVSRPLESSLLRFFISLFPR